MGAAAKKDELQSPLQSPMPELACPRCKQAMRLVSIEPLANSTDSRMLFACDCGFECRLSEQAAANSSASFQA